MLLFRNNTASRLFVYTRVTESTVDRLLSPKGDRCGPGLTVARVDQVLSESKNSPTPIHDELGPWRLLIPMNTRLNHQLYDHEDLLPNQQHQQQVQQELTT